VPPRPTWISLTEGVEKEGQKRKSLEAATAGTVSHTSHTTDKLADLFGLEGCLDCSPCAYKSKQIRASEALADEHTGEVQETTINLFKRFGDSGLHLRQHVAVGLQTVVVERDKNRTAYFSKLFTVAGI